MTCQTSATGADRSMLQRSPLASRLALLLAALALTTLPACNATRVSEENSRLRRENLTLKEHADKYRQQVERLEGQVAALDKKLAAPPPAVRGVKRTDLPVVSALAFGKFSGAYDSNGDGVDDTIRVYLQTLDQKGRFLPAVGEAVVQAVSIEPGKQPVKLAERRYDPAAFDNAYISGLTGTHYTLELKLPADLPDALTEATVKVTFTDAATGGEFTKQLAATIRRK